ncbi:fibronectin type III domain-containing protein [Hymenobacter cellulosilyticus]|uniref:Fibronectin type III domain-containing protein n=1 Tax=Hymenobacter cellulosilyticus TaxID=2932248 RepID=A0A8T9Q1A6_9BACT|nr:fibronectin type III domain-containing protein [Hymenobacter cellulosilyticus]UOQ71254.1 fibronectin type III domain-containing protein [Hymenobacter cellulosilyticus]
MGEPVPTEMSRTGFTVSFTTQNPGDTKVEYGKTSALGTVVANATQTTKHNIALTDLQPGTVYYVKVSSTNAVGRSESAAVPMITDTKKRATSRTRTAEDAE